MRYVFGVWDLDLGVGGWIWIFIILLAVGIDVCLELELDGWGLKVGGRVRREVLLKDIGMYSWTQLLDCVKYCVRYVSILYYMCGVHKEGRYQIYERRKGRGFHVLLVSP